MYLEREREREREREKALVCIHNLFHFYFFLSVLSLYFTLKHKNGHHYSRFG